MVWLDGARPSSAAWPASWNLGNAQATFTLVGTFTAVTVPAFTCSNYMGTDPNCHPSGSGNQRTTCPSLPWRKMSYLSALTLQAQLPDACSNSLCTATAFTTDSCSATYVTYNNISAWRARRRGSIARERLR